MEKKGSLTTIRAIGCWSRLYDGLMAGLAHDLAGRASALHSLTLLGRRGAPSESFVLDELESEMRKLTRLGEAVGALVHGTGGANAGTGDVALETLLPRTIEILILHHRFGGDELEVDVGESALVRAPAAELTMVLLLLAADVATRGPGMMRVLSGEESSATVTIELRHSASDASGDLLLSDGDSAELSRLMAMWSSVLTRTDMGWTVDLPVAEELGS